MYDFIVREVLTALTLPAHLLLMAGVGLLLGQQGWRQGWMGILALLAGAVTGLVLVRVGLSADTLELILLALSALIGALLAWKRVLPVWFILLLGFVTGGLLTMDSKPSLIPGMSQMTVDSILGATAFAYIVLVSVISAVALLLNRLLSGLILRILGSWVIASAAMVLALQLAPVIKG